MRAMKLSFWLKVLIFSTFTRYSDCLFESKVESFLKNHPDFQSVEKTLRSKKQELNEPKGLIQHGNIIYLYQWIGDRAYVLLDPYKHILVRDVEHDDRATVGKLHHVTDNVYVNGHLMCSQYDLDAQHNPTTYVTSVRKRGEEVTIEKMKPCPEDALLIKFQEQIDGQKCELQNRQNRSSIFKKVLSLPTRNISRNPSTSYRPSLTNSATPSSSKGPSEDNRPYLETAKSYLSGKAKSLSKPLRRFSEYSAEKLMEEHPGFKKADDHIFIRSDQNEASGTFSSYIYRWVNQAWYVIIDKQGIVLVRDASTRRRTKLFYMSSKGIESKVGTLGHKEDNVFVNGQLFCVNLELNAAYDPTAHTTAIFKDTRGIVFQYFKPKPMEELHLIFQQGKVRVDEGDLRRKGPVERIPDHHVLQPKPEEKRYGPDGKLIKDVRFRENPVTPLYIPPAPFKGALKKTPSNTKDAEDSKENRLPHFNRGNSSLQKGNSGNTDQRTKESGQARNSVTWLERQQPIHHVTSGTRRAVPQPSHKQANNNRTWFEKQHPIHHVTTNHGTRTIGQLRSHQETTSTCVPTRVPRTTSSGKMADDLPGFNSKFANSKINADNANSSKISNQGDRNLCQADSHLRDKELTAVEKNYRLWLPITSLKEDFESVSWGYQQSPLTSLDTTPYGYILYSPKGMLLVSAWSRNNDHYCLVDIGVQVNVYKSDGDRVFPPMGRPRSRSDRYATVDTNKDVSRISVVTQDEPHFQHPLLKRASERIMKNERVRYMDKLEGFREERGVGYALITYDGYMMVFSEMTAHEVYWKLPEERANAYFNSRMFYPKKRMHDEGRATTEVKIDQNGMIKISNYDKGAQRWMRKASYRA